MKTSRLIYVFLLLSVLSFGQSLREQMDAVQRAAAPLTAKRTENTKVLAALNQTKDDLSFGVAAFQKSATKYAADIADYTIDLGAYSPAAAEVNLALDAHNANVCQKTQYNSCGAYDAEAQRLNSRRDYLLIVKAGLDQRKGFLDTTLVQLKELQAILIEKAEKYTEDAKAFNAQNDDNEAKIVALKARYDAIIAQLKPCLDKLPPNPSDEQMHEVCGQLWDGNRTDLNPVINQGTGGASHN